MLRLAQKAFFPAKLPFPLLHVDTTYKFREMIEFRDLTCATLGVDLIVAAVGGARREEERSRAKERIYSFRDMKGTWDPRNQRPEPWNLFNSRIEKGESIRAFPLSNWTEIDIWQYIHQENIPVVPPYFARQRQVLVRGSHLRNSRTTEPGSGVCGVPPPDGDPPSGPCALLIPLEHEPPLLPGEKPQTVMCRMRWLGCTYCSGAIRSTAVTVPEIIEELGRLRKSERENRVIDHDEEGSMELKKREGYF
jgi:sulfate adenylyltransferase subunit 2